MVKIGVFLWKAIDHPSFFPLKTPSFHASTGGDLADVFHIASAQFLGGKKSKHLKKSNQCVYIYIWVYMGVYWYIYIYIGIYIYT